MRIETELAPHQAEIVYDFLAALADAVWEAYEPELVAAVLRARAAPAPPRRLVAAHEPSCPTDDSFHDDEIPL